MLKLRFRFVFEIWHQGIPYMESNGNDVYYEIDHVYPLTQRHVLFSDTYVHASDVS